MNEEPLIKPVNAWIQKDGTPIEIKSMSDAHLENALRTAHRLLSIASVEGNRVSFQRAGYLWRAAKYLQAEITARQEAKLLDECGVGGLDCYGSLDGGAR